MANNSTRNIRRRRKRRKQQIQTGIAIAILAILIVIFIVAIIKLSSALIGGKEEKSNPTTTTSTTQQQQTSSSENSTSNNSTTAPTTQEPTTPEPTTPAVDKTAWNLVLVNRNHPIQGDPDITLTNITSTHKVDSRMADALKKMLAAAKEEGLNPIICSSFRTMEKQTQLYNKEIQYFKNKGYDDETAVQLASESTAIPGTSEHQLGLAVDIVAASYQLLDKKQEETAEQKWLMANCHKYGFILRYPESKKDITMIMYEPWHYRYVGVEAATYIMENGICLEEYLGVLN